MKSAFNFEESCLISSILFLRVSSAFSASDFHSLPPTQDVSKFFILSVVFPISSNTFLRVSHEVIFPSWAFLNFRYESDIAFISSSSIVLEVFVIESNILAFSCSNATTLDDSHAFIHTIAFDALLAFHKIAFTSRRSNFIPGILFTSRIKAFIFCKAFFNPD